MITLNTDHGLQRIEKFDDVYEMPGFVVDVNPKTVKLEEIIGNYNELEFVVCGLSSCHRKHGKGYLVRIADGSITNIGKDCGKTHFGVDFESMRRNFDRDIQNKERRENLKAFQHLIPDYRENVTELRTQKAGADWIFGAIKALTTPDKGVPESIVEVVRKIRLTRNPALTKPRFATSEEIRQIEVAERREIEGPYYIAETVGQLQGTAALYPENNLRELLALGLVKLFKDIESLNVDSLTSPQLRTNIIRITGVDSQMSLVSNAIAEGRKFLQPENLKLLLEFAEHQDDYLQFEKFLQSLQSCQ